MRVAEKFGKVRVDDESSRFEACRIVYEDYLGTTFFMDDLLREKTRALKELLRFERRVGKETSLSTDFWYPIADMSMEFAARFPAFHRYERNDGVLFDFVNEKGESTSNYLLDPSRLIFYAAWKDALTSPPGSDKTKTVARINEELFAATLRLTGNLADRNGRRLLAFMLASRSEGEMSLRARESNETLSQASREYVLRDREKVRLADELTRPLFAMAEKLELSSETKSGVPSKRKNV